MSYKPGGVIWNDDGTMAAIKPSPLEPLKEARNFRDEKDKNLVVIDIDYFNRCLDGIESALKEYELMKEIRITARFDLAQVNKEHKALEIIKEKKVNVRAFLKCCHREDGLTIYNNQCDDKQEKESKELTQEEYDLLREVLL